MNNITKCLLGLVVVPVSIFVASNAANAGLVAREWFFGTWDCKIDGRPAKMQWLVVDDPQTTCSGDICSTTSGVKVIGRFSDNGSPWVALGKRFSNNTRQDLGIRYLGKEQDDWYLKYNTKTGIADGWTTWRRNRYPLQCRNRR